MIRVLTNWEKQRTVEMSRGGRGAKFSTPLTQQRWCVGSFYTLFPQAAVVLDSSVVGGALLANLAERPSARSGHVSLVCLLHCTVNQTGKRGQPSISG
jgi:hypothetical protein